MKKQGLSLGCPKDVAPTAVKKLQVQDGRNLLDIDDEIHSTDANRDEREEENDSLVENNESAGKTESTDHQKNDGIGDGHSTTTQVCHNIFCSLYLTIVIAISQLITAMSGLTYIKRV